MQIKTNHPLAPLTTLGIGGPADYFAEVSTSAELTEALQYANERKLPVYLLGGGSNLYFSDAGYRGLVIKNSISEITWQEGCQVLVGAGAPLGQLVREAAEAGCAGLTWAAGLPGTVGGAICGNAGAYGTEIGTLVASATVLSRQTYAVQSVEPDFFQFAYRSSHLKGSSEYILLTATLTLTPGNREQLLTELAETARTRTAKQPQGRTAGSFFKNPSKQKAWELIDSAGLRGMRVGDAAVSEAHANYLINLGQATATELEALAQQIEKAVLEKHGIQLEREVLAAPEC